MSLAELEKHRKEIYLCSRCGYCREMVRARDGTNLVCPVREHTGGFDAYTAKGRLVIARALLEHKIKIADNLVDIVYSCTLCGNCTEHCLIVNPEAWNAFPEIKPQDHLFDPAGITQALREDIFRAGLIPSKHRKLLEWCKEEHNPYMERHGERVRWVPEGKKLPSEGEIAFFMGCTMPYREPDLCRAVAEIMEDAGVNPAIIRDEWCCGSIFLRVGAKDFVRELAEHNIRAIETIGAKTVVTHCPGCFRTLKIDYPKLVGKLPFEVIHTTEFVRDLIKKGQLKPKAGVKAKVSYHDPCHLGRHAGIYDAPREVLRAIPEVDLVELPRTRQNSMCCGAGGGVKSGFQELAVAIGTDRIKEAEEVRADCLVSACPFCLMNLRDAAKMLKSNIKVYDILELLANPL